jgi:hypothetical protein
MNQNVWNCSFSSWNPTAYQSVARWKRHRRLLARRLRDKIALPKVGTLEFSASSIADTIVGLQSASMDMPRENVTLVAMNTKLSFIGAALFALQNRAVRMVYAVPERYNPLYCKGSGRVERFDITEDVKKAATTPVH